MHFFSVFLLALSVHHPLTAFLRWLPIATEATCFLSSHMHQEQKGHFSTPLNKVLSMMLTGVLLNEPLCPGKYRADWFRSGLSEK